MNPIGNKYLVKVDVSVKDEAVGGIYLPQGSISQNVHYKGTVVAHGTAMTENELIPEGSKIYFDWKNKEAKTKLHLDNSVYYICDPIAIIALDTEEDSE